MKKTKRSCSLRETFMRSGRLRTLKTAFLLGLFLLSGRLSAQEARTVSLSLENASLQSVFREIGQQTGYDFVYTREVLDRVGPRSVTVDNASLNDAMQQSLNDTPLTFRITGNTVVIMERAAQQAQQQPAATIRGKVTDRRGNPLAGAFIEAVDANRAAITDHAGAYTLAVPAAMKAIRVSFIGFRTAEIPYTGQTTLDIRMEEEAKTIDEVVVPGIFTKPRETYTGAATVITAEELKMAGNRSILSAIRNIDPSFNIAEDITIGSDPNKLPTITIRGSSSLPVGVRELQDVGRNTAAQNMPLIILNGFEVSLQRLYDMDESIVESITLLKDASATALYGTRGSNGVVLITTKIPQQGRLLITYKGDMNVEYPDLTSYNMMNAREKLTFEELSGLYESPSAIITEEVREILIKKKMEVERGVDTYWLKYPVRTGIGQRHSLGIEGGENSFRYGANLAFNNIEGAMKKSSRNTMNGNLLFIYSVANVTFKNDLQISLNKAHNSPYGTFREYGRLNSYYIPYNEDGSVRKVLENSYYRNFGAPYRVLNPLYNAGLPQRNTSEYLDIMNNFSIEWHVMPELFVRAQLGVMTRRDRSDSYVSADHTAFDGYTGEDYERKGQYIYGTGNYNQYDGQVTVNYTKMFNDKHLLFVGIGGTISQQVSENYSMVGEGILVPETDFMGMARKYLKNGRPGASEGIMRSAGMLVNVNYTYDNRYFFDLSGKSEGSSQFGANKRMAPFWSAGLGWNVHNESFFRTGRVVNSLRLRLSYGITGSQQFAPYLAYTSYSDSGGMSYQGGYAVRIMALGNENLEWEQTAKFNAGADIDLFGNRIRMKADVYMERTKGFLSDVNLPTASGFRNYVANIGEVENKGIELAVNAFILRNTSGLSWSVGGMVAHNVNTIKKISESLKAMNDQLLNVSNVNPSFLYEEGKSINTIYTVRSKGIDPSSGREIFIGRDGTETFTWDPRDKVATGLLDPKVVGSFNTMLRYGGFSLAAYFNFRVGGQAYNEALAGKVENILPYNNADRRALYDRWKTPGEKALFKSVRDLSTTNATSRFVMDNNSFSLQSIALTYECPQEWSQQCLGMEYCSLSFYMEDLLHLASIKRERGLDYPFSRKFSISLSTRF